MKRHRAGARSGLRIIKVGAVYRDTERKVLVVAEDHEIRAGRRTGRIVVCSADDRLRFPRRWYCNAADLREVQRDLIEPHPDDGRVSP